MILITHAIVGGAIASLLPSQPALAVCAAFASHFAIDAIPHWDYPLRSISVAPGHRNSFALTVPLLRDVSFIALDTCAGLLSSLLLQRSQRSSVGPISISSKAPARRYGRPVVRTSAPSECHNGHDASDRDPYAII